MTQSSNTQEVLEQVQAHIAQAKNPAVLDEIFKWREALNSKSEIHAFYPEFFGMVFLRKLSDGDFKVAMYSNRRKKPDFYFWESDMAKINQKIELWVKACNRVVARKSEIQAQKAVKKASTPKPQELAQIGDIFVETFGYDETHYKFYQLVEFKGKTMGVFREIQGNYEHSYNGFDVFTPIKDGFKDDELLTKRLQVDYYMDEYHVSFKTYNSYAKKMADNTSCKVSSFRR